MNEDSTQRPNAPVDPVFPRFFKGHEEPGQRVLGLIAYGLYEETRREWADACKTREGRYPNEEELRAYERSWTASRLEALKAGAAQILAGYADSVATQVEAQTLRNAVKGGFVQSVWRWLFSASLFALLVFGILMAASRSGIDVEDTLRTWIRGST